MQWRGESAGPSGVALLGRLSGFVVLAGCLWIPGFPPDKILRDPDDNDSAVVSHCTPHEGQGRPVLLSTSWGPREFSCRFRADAEPTWTIEFEDGTHLPLVVGAGVSRVEVTREALPFSPEPYSVVLRMTVPGDGREVTYSWRLIVVPHPDDLFEQQP